MKYMTCGLLSWRLIYLAFAPIWYVLIFYFGFSIDRGNGKPLSLITFSSLISFCQCTAGLGYIYSLFFNRKKIVNKTISKITRETFKVKIIREKTSYWSYCLIIFGLAFITFLQNVILALMSFKYSTFTVDGKAYKSTLDFQLIGFAMFFIITFSYFILHYSLYRHQIVSLSFMITGICFILFPNVAKEENKVIKIPVFIAEGILSAIRYVSEKWVMERKFTTSHQLLFYEGLISLILGLIVGFCFLYSNDFVDYYGSSLGIFYELGECFMFRWYPVVLSYVTCLLYNSFMMLTRYYYTPMHCCVANLLSSFFMWSLLISQGMTIKDNSWATILGFLLLLFGELLYNEIIICYLFKLHYFTGKEISLRSNIEFQTDVIIPNSSNVELIAPQGCKILI